MLFHILEYILSIFYHIALLVWLRSTEVYARRTAQTRLKRATPLEDPGINQWRGRGRGKGRGRGRGRAGSAKAGRGHVALPVDEDWDWADIQQEWHAFCQQRKKTHEADQDQPDESAPDARDHPRTASSKSKRATSLEKQSKRAKANPEDEQNADENALYSRLCCKCH